MKAKIVQIDNNDNNVLRQIAKEIPPDQIKTKKIRSLIKKMEEALKENKEAVAIAAPQIGESLRIFVIAKKILGQELPFPRFVFINPVIKKISKKKNSMPEGCLSVRGYYGEVKRAKSLIVEALDENGEKFSLNASGFFAQIIQHEVDHLNGILFIDKAVKMEELGDA